MKSKQNLKVGLWLIFYVAFWIIGGFGVPGFLMWPLFFDGPWYPIFISLIALFIGGFFFDLCFKSIQPPIPKISLLMAKAPSAIIGWMWIVALSNTIFHFGKALFYDGSWAAFIGALCLSVFFKMVTKEAMRDAVISIGHNKETDFQKILLLAEQGNSEAQNDLGIMYDNGDGVPQDHQAAAKWYRLSAEQGQAVAQFNLGNMYDLGLGVTQDYVEAAAWFRLAAEQGYNQAQFNLGFIHSQGQGVPLDNVEAAKWYRLATERGISLAKNRLETLETKMTTQQIAEAQRLAREWKPKGK